MNQSEKFILITSVFFLLLSISCICEDTIDCNNHLCFVYDYNLQYTDLFSKEVSEISLFVFNSRGELVYTHEEEVAETFPPDYTLSLPLEEEEEYTFIVWSGLYENFYTQTLTRSETDHNDQLTISLNSDEEHRIIKKRLPPLWYGKLEKRWERNSPGIVRLVKDSNTIRIVMKNLDDESDEVNIDDLDIIFSCSNGIYNSSNEPLPEQYEYHPYYKTQTVESGSIAELNTLRLMADQENSLEIIHRESGENILGKKLNLNTYFDAIRLLKYNEMSLQEYLDRENQYGIVFFYKGYNKENCSFAHITIQINGWTIRDQDIKY